MMIANFQVRVLHYVSSCVRIPCDVNLQMNLNLHMSSPIPDELLPQPHLGEVDDPMQGLGQEEEEGEGDVLMPGVTDDSSEEGEDDEEEFRRITEGFIVDEEEEEEEEEEAPRKRRKRRKRHHRGEFPATGFRSALLALTGISRRDRNIGRR